MKSPGDKVISFLYVSHPLRKISWRWTARLTFPAGAVETTVLTLEILDGDANPVDGVFELAGKKIQIVDGGGSLTYADFIAGKHSTGVWLYRKGIDPIPGGLTFG